MRTGTIGISIDIARTDVTGRVHGRLLRDAHRAAAEYHVAHHLTQHFEDNAKTRPGGAYKVRRRSKRWSEFKRRRVGHEIPNVLTGGMRLHVLASAAAGITATQNRAVIRLRNRFAMSPDRWEEITSLAPGEFRKVRQVAQEAYVDASKRPENRPQRKLRLRG